MSDQRELFPSGLSRSQFDRLTNCASQAANLPLAGLLNSPTAHRQPAPAAYQGHRMSNVRLAAAIVERFQAVIESWFKLQPNQQYWLAGSILYFSVLGDAEPDFCSPIG